jgi:hypothetical protein
VAWVRGKLKSISILSNLILMKCASPTLIITFVSQKQISGYLFFAHVFPLPKPPHVQAFFVVKAGSLASRLLSLVSLRAKSFSHMSFSLSSLLDLSLIAPKL